MGPLSTYRRKILRTVTVLALAATGVVATATPSHAASISSSCTASRSYYNGAWGGQGYVKVNVSITLYYTGRTVTSAAYSFSNPRFEANAGGTRSLSLGPSGNVNVLSPVSRTSPDSMGTAGTYNFTDFTVSAGTVVNVQGIPDVPNISDPMCSVYIRIG